MWSANVRRRSRVEFCSALRKCSARVEARRLLARNDGALYLELVVEVLIIHKYKYFGGRVNVS